MLKSVLFSGVACALLCGGAFAADLPSRTAPSYYQPPLPTFSWTGAYFGLNAGYGFSHEGRFKTTEAFFPTLPTRVQTVSTGGFTAGGQFGYNYQFGAGNGLVVGVEADAAFVDANDARTPTYAFDGQSLFGTTTTYRSKLDFLGTVRGRVGYAFNQFLVYGTGGFAYGGVDNRVSVANLASGSVSDTQTGYALGAGVEYALPSNSFLNVFHSNAMTLKAEYLHYDLGSTKIAVNSPAGLNVFNSKVTNNGDLVRVGVNFKFGAY